MFFLALLCAVFAAAAGLLNAVSWNLYLSSTAVQEGLLNLAMLDTIAGSTNTGKQVEINKRRSAVKGTIILMVFFVLFTGASLLIPSPMFPGNVFCTLIGGLAANYTTYVSAVFNGVLYAVALWLVFIAISRRLEQEK